jgi:hypothetical protein
MELIMPKKSKKKTAKKTQKKEQTAEELIAGLRRKGGHLPTKASEAARKKRKKKGKNS